MALDIDRLRKPIKKLGKLTRSARQKAAPAPVHRLRTNTRRIEAILPAVGLEDAPVLSLLKQVRKRAGKVRDMDVLTSDVASLDVENEEESKLELLAYLGSRRHKYARKLQEFLDDNGAAIRRELKRSGRQLESLVDGRQQGVAAHAATAAMEASNALQQPRRLTRTNLHPYRLDVKHLRYLLQMSDHPDERFIKALQDVQDAIGEWHDWQELGGIASEVLKDRKDSGVIREIRSKTEDKYREAIAKTNQMRKRFLQVPVNGGPEPARMTSSRREAPVLASATLAA